MYVSPSASSHPELTTGWEQTEEEQDSINISPRAIDRLIDEDGNCACLCVGGVEAGRGNGGVA